MDAKTRFLRYVTYYTTSDESTGTSPSTARQKELGALLMQELADIGLQAITMDACGNVIATLPANTKAAAPVLALIAHMDTAPDAPGENVKPRIVHYEGGDIPLNDTVSLTEALCPGLCAHAGEDLIVTDGTTLLGADDKAGIAEIMAAVEILAKGDRPHGEVRVIFTTDEEIGNGVVGLDVPSLGCDFGYTLDGGPVDELEFENFNAADAYLTVHGIGVHPGSAKNVMVNACGVACAFHAMLPQDEVPEKTDGYEGFFHLHQMDGCLTEAHLRYLIRDFDRTSFEARKAQFLRCADEINRKYGAGTAEARVVDSYYNMREKIEPHMELIDRAKAAFARHGIALCCKPIRGGTDGARLSWDGLPCPNLPTGGYNYHGIREWIPVDSLRLMTDVVVDLVSSFTAPLEELVN